MPVSTIDAARIECLIDHLSTIEQIRRGTASHSLTDHEKNLINHHKRAATTLLVDLFTDLQGPFDHPLAKSPSGS